jgi:hypothetical protein
MDPPVSDPSAATARPAFTDAADPPLEPPDTYSRFKGFLTGPNAEFSFEPPIANSSIFSFPKNTTAQSFKRFTTVAS